jgi:hypothetical protein
VTCTTRREVGEERCARSVVFPKPAVGDMGEAVLMAERTRADVDRLLGGNAAT